METETENNVASSEHEDLTEDIEVSWIQSTTSDHTAPRDKECRTHWSRRVNDLALHWVDWAECWYDTISPQHPGRKDSGRGESLDGSDAMLEQDAPPAPPNLATETKYSLVKNQIVKAEKPVEEAPEVTTAEVHSKSEEETESEAEEDKSNKSVKFNEENKLVDVVGSDEYEGDEPLELEEAANIASARAVSTPASESSPRPSAAEDSSLVEASRVASAKSVTSASAPDNQGLFA